MNYFTIQITYVLCISFKSFFCCITEARITDDTVKLENIPFNDSAVLDDGTTVNRPCCQDKAQNK